MEQAGWNGLDQIYREFPLRIFFDDQLNHLDPASGVVSSVWVPLGIRNQHLYSDQLGAKY
jgi:hypothetical protein